MVDAKV
jgi:hypothetical protein